MKKYLIMIGSALLAIGVFALKMFSAGKRAQKTKTEKQQRKVERETVKEAKKVRQETKEKLNNARTTDDYSSLNDD